METTGDTSDRHQGQAVREGARVFSAQELLDGARIWIVTEADRSATTILLPEEY